MEKTRKIYKNVEALLANMNNKKKHDDCVELCDLMADVLGTEPQIWNNNTLIAFGGYRLGNRNSDIFDYFWTGFTFIKRSIIIYLAADFEENKELFQKLGKYRMGGESNIYVNKLTDIDMSVLRELIKMSKQY